MDAKSFSKCIEHDHVTISVTFLVSSVARVTNPSLRSPDGDPGQGVVGLNGRGKGSGDLTTCGRKGRSTKGPKKEMNNL